LIGFAYGASCLFSLPGATLIFVWPQHNLAIGQSGCPRGRDVLEREGGVPKLASQICLSFTLESNGELHLITFPEDIINIKRLRKATIAGIPDSRYKVFPSECFCGAAFLFLLLGLVLEPNLSEVRAILVFSNGLETVTGKLFSDLVGRYPLLGPACRFLRIKGPCRGE
jgi:hypothetical protein